MAIDTIVFFILILLAASIAIPPVADKLRLPTSSILVLAGFLISEVLVSSGIDTGIRADSFQALIVFIFLPILVFDSAFRIDTSLLLNNLSLILTLAIVAMILSALIAATGIYFGINHPTGFPWTTALVTGALLVATDPVAVVSQLQSMKAPHRLEILLEGESLFNDATAIVLFSLFLTLALATDGQFEATTAAFEFSKLFLGGALTGALFGIAGNTILRFIKTTNASVLFIVFIAYGSFYTGEHLLHVSGIMSTLLAGLVMGYLRHRQLMTRGSMTEEQTSICQQQQFTLGLFSELANNFVFLLMGVTITIAMFTERWLAMLIAIVATLIARVIGVYIGVLIGERLPGSGKVPAVYKPVMVWGGLRGVVTLALALSLPTSLEGWWTVQAIAFGVVIFSLWFQAPTNQFLVKRVLAKADTDSPTT